jgi:hypothetical protein
VTEAQAMESMTQRWLDAWPGLQPGVPYTFKGELFEAVSAWARITFRPTVRKQATMGPAGGRRFEDRGVIFVQLFVDAFVGEARLVELADSVREVYESRTIGASEELVTFAASRRMGGDDGRGGTVVDDGRWTMSVMTIPYWFDQQR